MLASLGGVFVVVGTVEVGGASWSVGVLGAAAVVELGSVGRIAVAELVVPAVACIAMGNQWGY